MADFNHDGQFDVLVTNGTSANQVWLYSGGVVALNYWSGWQLLGFIDRNGDGYKDVLYQQSGASVQQVDYYMGGTTRTGYLVTSGLAADVVVAANEGTDTISSSISHTLASGVESLILAGGAGAINGTGNALDNIVTGNESANTLIGGLGADTLMGGAGDDRFVLAAGCGADRILDFVSGGTIDEIDLTAFGISSFAAVMGQAQDQGGNATITLAAGDILTIVGVSVSQLQAGDFVL